MPHVNLLYPFVSADKFADAATKLSAALKDLEPFEVTFDTFNFFAHSGSSNVWLNPSALPPFEYIIIYLEDLFLMLMSI